MDELSLVLEDESAPDDIPMDWEDTGEVTGDLPDVGGDDTSGDDVPVWADGETGDSSTGEDDGFIDDEGTGGEELIGDDGAEVDWLIDDEFVWEGDWGCGTVDPDWEILIPDDFIRIYDIAGGPKTEDGIPADGVPEDETATLGDPAICMIFVCDTII